MKSAAIGGHILLHEISQKEFVKKISQAMALLEQSPKILVKSWCSDEQGYEIGLFDHYYEVVEWDDNSLVCIGDNGKQRFHLTDEQRWRYVKLELSV